MNTLIMIIFLFTTSNAMAQKAQTTSSIAIQPGKIIVTPTVTDQEYDTSSVDAKCASIDQAIIDLQNLSQQQISDMTAQAADCRNTLDAINQGNTAGVNWSYLDLIKS